MKCPSCGTFSKNGTTVCPKCGRYCGRTFKYKNDDVFTTINRTQHNGGYTQQNTKAVSQQYTGIDASKKNDGMFYSASEQNKTENNSPAQNTDDFHNPDTNPYDNKAYNEIRRENIPANAHIEEFVANNIIEFSKHRFGREIVNKIFFMLLALIGTDLIGLFFDIILDATHLTYPIAITYTAVLILLSFTAMKTFRASVTITIVGITLIYTIPIAVIFLKTHIVLTAKSTSTLVDLLFIFVPFIGQYILSTKVNSNMRNYIEHWEAYNQRGTYVIDDMIIHDYEFYESDPDKEIK